MSVHRSPKEPPPDLLTAAEVAQRLAIGVRTLWRLVLTGDVPAPVRFGRRLTRWVRADLDRFIEQLAEDDRK